MVAWANVKGEIPSQPIQILPHLFYENIIDHYNNPHNVGSFNKNDLNINTSLVGAPACGDVMEFQIKIDNKQQKPTKTKLPNSKHPKSNQ
ncbi:hypothetical protein J1N35_015467 [Gossypium stocksii]|uniref:NIF system FeS cluster assembly NifU N-terminal domain-containing protein n=1 Tax=Gossypium stocksii TaxID=47602 RepID=A0A9D3VXY2_9ROSI|nr:hypothetical protein J1N35_015467 [Gossypium stocksii]